MCVSSLNIYILFHVMIFLDVENAAIWELSRFAVLSFSSWSTGQHVPSSTIQTCRQGNCVLHCSG